MAVRWLWVGVFAAWAACPWTSARQDPGPLAQLTDPLVAVVDRFLDGLAANGSCSGSVTTLLKAAREQQKWALTVLDASGRPDSGLLTGSTTFPGSYSECLSGGASKHCLADLRFGRLDTRTALGFVLNGTTVRLGLCFPDNCLPQDATAALHKAVSSSFPGSSSSVDMGQCSTEEHLPELPALVVVLCIFAILIFLAAVGTALDLGNFQCGSGAPVETNAPGPSISTEQLCEEEPQKTPTKSIGKAVRDALVCFSFVRNGSKILDTGSESSVGCFHGMRFLSMTWIMTGHTFSFASLWLSFRNLNDMSQSPTYLLSQTIANGTLSVDTFFYLSGFLVVFVAMRNFKRKPEKFNIPLVLLHRYIRLTPLMMLIIAFCAVLLPFMGRGPFWNEAILMYGPWCQKNWWVNAIYLQNFLDTENMCLSHSWYSAVDTQFFVVSLAVLFLLRKKPVFGLCLILLLFVTTVIVTVYLTVAHHLPGTSYIGIFPQTDQTAYQVEVYIKPYCRMGPYLVGMVAGYWMQSPQDLVRLGKKYIVIGWCLAVVLNLVVLYSTWPAYEGYLPTTAGAAAYSALTRTGWALGLAWLTYACVTGNGGVVNKILSWKPLVPVSRLTYCAYLIHPVVLAAFYGSQETTFHFSIYFMIYLLLGNVVITYVAAFILSTFLESPFIALEKIVFDS